MVGFGEFAKSDCGEICVCECMQGLVKILPGGDEGFFFMEGFGFGINLEEFISDILGLFNQSPIKIMLDLITFIFIDGDGFGRNEAVGGILGEEIFQKSDLGKAIINGFLGLGLFLHEFLNHSFFAFELGDFHDTQRLQKTCDLQNVVMGGQNPDF